MNINRENYESWFVDYVEGTLSPGQVAEVNRFLQTHADLRAELELWEETVLEVDQSVQFEHKELLKRRSRIIPLWLMRGGLAAAAILAIFLLWKPATTSVSQPKLAIEESGSQSEGLQNTSEEQQGLASSDTEVAPSNSTADAFSTEEMESTLANESERIESSNSESFASVHSTVPETLPANVPATKASEQIEMLQEQLAENLLSTPEKKASGKTVKENNDAYATNSGSEDSKQQLRETAGTAFANAQELDDPQETLQVLTLRTAGSLALDQSVEIQASRKAAVLFEPEEKTNSGLIAKLINNEELEEVGRKTLNTLEDVAMVMTGEVNLLESAGLQETYAEPSSKDHDQTKKTRVIRLGGDRLGYFRKTSK